MKPLRFGVVCLLLAASAGAQSFRSSITGSVSDPTGATIPNAKVVATEIKTGVSRETATNSSGEYLVADLVPGSYMVTITAAGFKELRSEEIILTGNQVQRLDGHLQLGSASETVEVSAAAPTINTQDAQIAGLQTREELT
ncbi:MAG TPA: carboxypeptidase-like regulatory domain-containing protein, partial [Bryobacteraceae bacterium]|nr:carboxypeptidase-like regulatory domain-containing protein [Bryobacteraceae bacterium]